ncbi:MAG: hypothetical protein J6A37_06720 [Oscillospiraceae bacterium]|nr:hypothetical protein [Oscillospiraceae bacterium]
MKWVKSVFSICFQNIRKWRSDYRIWTIAVLLFVMLKIYVDDFAELSNHMQAEMSVWIFPFLYEQYYMKLIFTIPLVLLFCNAPFIDSNQIYVYIRAGRTRWLTGQILYVFIASGLYYLFILISSIILSLINGEFSFEWGKLLKTLADFNVSNLSAYPFIEISSNIIHFFTPIQAMGFTFLVSWSNAVLLGMIIFTLNYLTRQQYIGMTVASLLVVFSFFVEISGYPILINFSPTSWITLDKIDIGGMTEYPSFYTCLSIYWGVIFILIISAYIFGKRKEIDMRR